MRLWGEFSQTSSESDQPQALAAPPRSRRSLPPELVNAIDLERLRWTLHLKGVAAESVTPVPRARRLGVRFAGAEQARASAALGMSGALREIERRWPSPSLMPADSGGRKRVAALERWFCGEVAHGVLGLMLQPPMPGARGADRAMTAPIARALDLVSGLTERHPYLLGDSLSAADITVAATLAPVARKDGWIWAGRTWPPLGALAGRSALAHTRGAAWVRDIYARYAAAGAEPHHAEPARTWIP